MKLELLAFLTLAIAVSVYPQPQQVEKDPVPDAVGDCFQSPALKEFKIDGRVNPFYLRGDFDGDGKPDYAVRVRKNGAGVTGLAMCQGNGRIFVLGAGTTPPFTTKPEDNFLSSSWEVLTLAEFRHDLYNKRLGSNAKGEVISLNWEDGNGYVYWDGKKFRWFEEAAGGNK